MSVEVIELSRSYGAQKAVNGLTFSAGKGEIVGFLGPNGAGKSTTMKILTGYLPAQAGTVRVCGLDPIGPGVGARQQTGYLPENNPLYTEMYVREYLAYVARLYHVRYVAKAVSSVIGLTGLDPEKHKKIGNLSKGYRQRVGLAQALIHDPKVLILDEPTSGLDPNQLTGIRKLIRELGATKTVIFSTHIMQEVEAVCDRVVIIDKGLKVADAKVSELLAGSQLTEVYIAEFEHPGDYTRFMTIPGVLGVESPAASIVRITASQGAGVRQEIFRLAVEMGLVIIGLRKEEASLESVFSSLTKDAN